MHATEALHEADRLMTICNACRYCEGLCAVFPAMEMRRTFAAGDLHYLANLCHQCGACSADCQYSPPHEFDVNVPRALAKLRNETYAVYAWPRAARRRVRAQRAGRDAGRGRKRRRLHRRLRRVPRSGGAVLAAGRRLLPAHAARAPWWRCSASSRFMRSSPSSFGLRAFWRGIDADSAARRPRRHGARPRAMPASSTISAAAAAAA